MKRDRLSYFASFLPYILVAAKQARIAIPIHHNKERVTSLVAAELPIIRARVLSTTGVKG
jgi:hypothetical protein